MRNQQDNRGVNATKGDLPEDNKRQEDAMTPGRIQGEGHIGPDAATDSATERVA